MKKLLYFLFIFPLFINAQAVCHEGDSKATPSNDASERDNGSNQIISISSSRNNNIKGTPYAFNDWCNGEIVTADHSNNYEKIQFDLEKNQILVYNNGSKFPSVFPTNQIKKLTARDSKGIRYFSMVNSSEFNDKKEESKLYEVFSNKNDYLIKETTKYVQSSNDDSGKMYYKKRSAYFIKDKSGKYVKTKLSKKHLLKILKDKEKDVLKYIKENKLTYKEKDVSKILSFYHSLT